MGSSPSPLFALLLAALALAAALAGCGGGTTGAPLTAAGGSTPAPSTAPHPATTAATPAQRRAAAGTSTSAGVRPATSSTAPPPSSTATQTAAPTTAPSATAPHPQTVRSRTLPVDETAILTLTKRVSPAHYFQAGVVTGTYAGTMTAEVRITSQGVLVTFTAALPGGKIAGHVLAAAVINGSTTPGLRGTAQITGGSGRFAGIRGSGLRVTGRAKPDGSYAHVRLTGTVTL